MHDYFHSGTRLVSKPQMVDALGGGAEAFAFTTFGGQDATWYAEAWRSAVEPYRYGVYGHAPTPFAAVLEDCPDESDAAAAAGAALARVIFSVVAADPGCAALHWKRPGGDELAVARTTETEAWVAGPEWFAAGRIDGIYEAYACGGDVEEAYRPAAEMVLRAGLIDETDPDAYADTADLNAVLSVEAWAAHVLARETRRRVQGVHGFLAGADEVAALLG